MKVAAPGIILIAIVVALLPGRADAQLSGSNTRGDYGLQSATQPDPGWYLTAPMYLRYHTGEFKDADGNAVLPDADDSLDVNALVLGMIYVSEATLFGGKYSVQAFPAWTNNNLEIPLFGLDENSNLAFADLYVQPVNLGWHTARADYTAGLGVYAPTGKYEFLGDGNVGLGMWGFEIFGGGTFYFDEARRWHVAATAFFETHTDKKDTDIRVGNLLTIEGGLGWSFLEGAAMVGAAYYAQWKVSDDDFGSLDVDQMLEESGLDVLLGVPIGKSRVFGLGPELSFPIVAGNKLVALLDARFLWEFGARTELEGSTFVVSATFPIPSLSLE